MSWDPTVAKVLYGFINVYNSAAQEVSSRLDSTTLAVEVLEKELSMYAPKAQSTPVAGPFAGLKITVISSGRTSETAMDKMVTAETIEKIKVIQASIAALAESIKKDTTGFAIILAPKIARVNSDISRVSRICRDYLARHSEILCVQSGPASRIRFSDFFGPF